MQYGLILGGFHIIYGQIHLLLRILMPKYACASNIHTRNICAENVFSIVDVYIKNIDPKGIYTEGINRKSPYIMDVGTIKHSKVYLQSFQSWK